MIVQHLRSLLPLLVLCGPALAQSPPPARIDQARISICVHYKKIAADLVIAKSSGMTYEQAANWAADKAYGPNGEVYRYSEDNAHAYMMLAAAAYFAQDKYGKGVAAFSQAAYDRCLRGELLDASPPP